MFAEVFIQRLAALVSATESGKLVMNALELDGYAVDTKNLCLVPLEAGVSAKQEEDALSALVKRTQISDAATIVAHIKDANELYVQAKYHASLNESRNLLQSLIDNVSGDTNRSSVHSFGYPGGMKNRVVYLKAVGFLTDDEEAAINSAWGALSAGSHPGVPAREEARIGLILALEFGQLLLLKFDGWKRGGFKAFA